MSTVVTWATEDDSGITSMYFISESRISWGKKKIWDHGQKVFSLSHGGIIAYCGDVLFPTQILSQIKDLIDKEIIFKKTDENELKITILKEYLDYLFSNSPIEISHTIILIGLVKNKQFNLYKFTINKKDTIFKEELEIKANVPSAFGSGKEAFKNVFGRLKGKIFSRDIYQAFFKTIEEEKDPLSGGVIQLVGIYRNSKSQTFGIIQNKKKYIYGQEIISREVPLNIEWRNRNFEIIDEKTLTLKSGAQKQPFNNDLIE